MPEPDLTALIAELERLGDVLFAQQRKRILTALKQAATDRECRDEHEDQLVRIAQLFGKDARHGPDGDPTIAGMVTKEVEQLRTQRDELAKALEPFAAFADYLSRCKHGHEVGRLVPEGPHADDCRRAAEVLAKIHPTLQCTSPPTTDAGQDAHNGDTSGGQGGAG